MKTIHPVTKQDVIKWLRRQKHTAKFDYFNNKPCGCLFTRYLRHTTGLKTVICCIDGVARVEATGREVGNIVPFHDDFWRTSGWIGKISRDTAIEILETI